MTTTPDEDKPATSADLINSALIKFTGCIGSAFDDICSYGLTIGGTYVPFDPDPEDADSENCDDYGCSQLWVRVDSVDANVPDSWGNGCSVTYSMEVEVGVVRCLDIPEDGEAPTSTDVLVAATQSMSDMNAILCAALGCDAVEEDFDSITPGTWVPLGPLGGQYGGSWTFTIEFV